MTKYFIGFIAYGVILIGFFVCLITWIISKSKENSRKTIRANVSELILMFVSSIGGFFIGLFIAGSAIGLLFRFLEFCTRNGFFKGQWVLGLLLTFFVGVPFGIFCSIFLGQIAQGRFNSKNWKINRFIVIFSLLLVTILLYSALALSGLLGHNT